MRICNYGCGREAKHQFKNGKWCCSKNISGCLFINRKQKISNTGKTFSEERRNNISKSLKGKKKTNDFKEHLRIINTGELNPHYGKKHTELTKKKFSLIHKLKIKQINYRYPLFYKIEKMRYNPDNLEEKEIQVHCKNHNCKKSKKDRWFTPTRTQLYERIRQIESKDGQGGCYFYCSNKCKKECPLFNLQSDPYKENKSIYTQQENQQFREFVLKRDNYKCQYCGNPAEHVHHERPQKTEPFFALDPDYGWSVCKECHYKYGHKDECSTGNLAKIICRSNYK